MMKRAISILILLMLISGVQHCNAQKYKSAVGVRMDGGMFGFVYSQRFFKRTTGEVNVDFRSREVKTTFVAKFHRPLTGKGLTFFGGIGYHLGNYKEFGGFSGSDFTVGFEHKILALPLSISFEINPSVHVTGEHPDWYTFQSAFSIKYILVRHKKKKKGLFKKKK